jgi:hypothetical protein
MQGAVMFGVDCSRWHTPVPAFPEKYLFKVQEVQEDSAAYRM